MSNPIENITARLIEGGCSPSEAAVLVGAVLAMNGASKAAENRRKWDREYRKKRRAFSKLEPSVASGGIHPTSTRHPPDTNLVEEKWLGNEGIDVAVENLTDVVTLDNSCPPDIHLTQVENEHIYITTTTYVKPMEVTVREEHMFNQNMVKQEKVSRARARENFTDEFAAWYKNYPRKVAKADALKAYAKARKGGASVEQLNDGLARYLAKLAPHFDPNFHPYPASWLNSERWNDEDHNLDYHAHLFAKPKLSPHLEHIKNQEKIRDEAFAALASGKIRINACDPLKHEFSGRSHELGAPANPALPEYPHYEPHH